MKSIGSGVREIRVKDSKGAFRVIYLASRPEGMYVLHCFAKQSERTELQDLRIAQGRLKSIGDRQ
jgi:phage-related protein